MQTLKLNLRGLAPLMLHNERLANPMDPVTRELKKLTSVKKKTDETLLEMMKVEWLGGLYLDEAGKIVVPSDNVHACLKHGARKMKLGKDVESSVLFEVDSFPIKYEGPSDPLELYELPAFRDYRGVKVGTSKVMRSRPIFRSWKLSIEFLFDPEIINGETLLQVVDIAGSRIGLCERRPRFGRFAVAA